MIGAARAPVCDHQESGRSRHRCAGFTLIDILVSMTVVAVLIGILLPSLSAIRETTRRVICSSNVRQQGYGLALYADDNNDYMPPTHFAPIPGAGGYHPEQTIIVRADGDPQGWDGLGWLFVQGYLDASGVYYCPSHTGEHPLSRYASEWYSGSDAELVCNYQYRGYHYRDNNNIQRGYARLTDLAGALPGAALVVDGLRTRDDYNHRVGVNILHADLGVIWRHDRGQLLGMLPADEGDMASSDKVRDAWEQLDGPN